MKNENVYERWLMRLWHGDYDVAEEIISEDFIGHWPENDIKGREALIQIISQTRSSIDNLRFTIEVGPVIDGEMLAARWSGKGDKEGELALIGHDLMRIEKNKIAEYWIISWNNQNRQKLK